MFIIKINSIIWNYDFSISVQMFFFFFSFFFWILKWLFEFIASAHSNLSLYIQSKTDPESAVPSHSLTLWTSHTLRGSTMNLTTPLSVRINSSPSLIVKLCPLLFINLFSGCIRGVGRYDRQTGRDGGRCTGVKRRREVARHTHTDPLANGSLKHCHLTPCVPIIVTHTSQLCVCVCFSTLEGNKKKIKSCIQM